MKDFFKMDYYSAYLISVDFGFDNSEYLFANSSEILYLDNTHKLKWRIVGLKDFKILTYWEENYFSLLINDENSIQIHKISKEGECLGGIQYQL